MTNEHTAPLAGGSVVVGLVGDELVSYVPLEPDGSVVIELAEPQATTDLLARIGWWSLALQSLALATLLAAVTFVLVRWLVGKPLGRLAGLARNIAEGNLEARVAVEVDASDEVTILGREMNRMAERLLEAKQTVEDLEAERTEALEQLRHADRLRTAGQLASVLAHELGTPLNVVSGHARLIEQEPDVGAEAKISARTILEQVARMTRIIKDLLGFVRRRGPQVSRLELGELAASATRTLEPLARRHKVKLTVRAKRPVEIDADAQQLLQVLTNLIVNATQAMPKGGAVRIEVAERQATPPTGVHAPPGRYACLAVVDEGVGIAPEDLERLFQPFFTRRSDGEGTGLGLAVVEGIVRDHHGWIDVKSELGQGSRFEVFLPKAGEARGESPRQADP